MRVSSWIATILLLLSIVAMATNTNTSGHFTPESSPQSGFLCTFTSTLSPSTITPGTPSVTVSGTDTCDPPESYLWATQPLPGNPKLVDYLSDPCDSIESSVNAGRFSPYPNSPSLNYASLWDYSAFYGNAFVKDFALTDNSGQFSGNYPTSSLKPGSYCIVLQVPCQIYYPTNGGFEGVSGVCQAPVYDNLNVVESSSPSISTSTSFTPICFTCYIFTSATSTSPTCTAFLCNFATISQPPAVTNTLPPAAVLGTDWAVLSASMNPPAPTVGQTVIFSMVIAAVSSSGSFPQNVYVQCVIDGANCGHGLTSYPGPVGAPFTITVNRHPWQTTVGTHTLTWSISTDNDPNPSNNVMSTTFTVGPAGQTTTQAVTTSTQPIPACTFSSSLSSSNITQGTTGVTVSGTDTCDPPGSTITSLIYSSPCPSSGLPIDVASSTFGNAITDSSNHFSYVAGTSGLSPGYYCVIIQTPSITAQSGGYDPLTVTPTTTQTSTSFSSTQTSSDLMSMIQQNQLLVLGAVILLAAVIIAVALRGRQKPTPTQPTKTGVTTGMVYCSECGTQNPTANQTWLKCHNKLN